mmetsp:Transcript_11592/g.34364  ORF Transcript_11592/g.34364 Transcript_11592/m.34364 type:complete len:252 (+) Transcript_11592:613-1368(+)
MILRRSVTSSARFSAREAQYSSLPCACFVWPSTTRGTGKISSSSTRSCSTDSAAQSSRNLAETGSPSALQGLKSMPRSSSTSPVRRSTQTLPRRSMSRTLRTACTALWEDSPRPELLISAVAMALRSWRRPSGSSASSLSSSLSATPGSIDRATPSPRSPIAARTLAVSTPAPELTAEIRKDLRSPVCFWILSMTSDLRSAVCFWILSMTSDLSSALRSAVCFWILSMTSEKSTPTLPHLSTGLIMDFRIS